MTIVIPGRLPCMNDLISADRRNRYAGAKLKKDTQEMLIPLMKMQSKGKKFKEKVLIKAKFFEVNRRRDEDNVISGLKFILDALQEAEIIKGDGQKYVHVLPEVFVDETDPRIEIEIK